MIKNCFVLLTLARVGFVIIQRLLRVRVQVRRLAVQNPAADVQLILRQGVVLVLEPLLLVVDVRLAVIEKSLLVRFVLLSLSYVGASVIVRSLIYFVSAFGPFTNLACAPVLRYNIPAVLAGVSHLPRSLGRRVFATLALRQTAQAVLTLDKAGALLMLSLEGIVALHDHLLVLQILRL